MSMSQSQAVCRTKHDADTEFPLSTTVISAVADIAGKRPEKLPPLYDYIDPEALDNLFGSRENNTVESVSFEFAGYPVTVYGSGEVVVYPRD